MSFLLKSSRLATGFIGFSRQAKFTSRRKRVFLSQWQRPFKINQSFVRFCAAVPETLLSLNKTKSVSETLYQKSISQLWHDIRNKGYIFKEDLDDACHTLKSSTPFTVEQTVLLIRSCGHNLPLVSISEKLELVKQIWDSFDDIGVEKNITHYNALLDVYVELEHEFCPMDFLRSLEEKQMIPNLETYKKLLHALSIQGKISNAQEILEHMKRHSVGIDNEVFDCLILGYSLQGDFISARGILELMKEKNLTLTSKSYVNLAMGYAKQGDIEKVKEILDECKTHIKHLSTTQFLELAYTFAVNNHSEQFSAILDMIPLKKNFPTVSTKVVHRLLHKRLDKEAILMFQCRDKLESANMVRETGQMFLDHYIRFREPEEVLEISKFYQEKGYSPIAFPYCLKETLLRRNVPHCLRFFDAMETQKYPVRVHYFYPILLKTGKSGNQDVLKMIKYMNKYQLTLSREILRAFHRFYNFQPGAEFNDLEKLKSVGIDKKLAAWKILDVLFIRGDVNTAMKLVSNCGILYPGINLPLSMANAFKKMPKEHEKFVYILYHLIHNLKINKKMNEVQPFEYEQFIFEMVKSCSKNLAVAVMEEMLKKKIPLSQDAAALISKNFSDPNVPHLLSKLTSPDLKFEYDEKLLDRLSDKKMELFNKLERKDKWLRLENAIQRNASIPTVVKMFEDLAEKPESSKDKKYKNVVEKLLKYVSNKGDVLNTERIYEVGVQKNLLEEDFYAPCFIAHLVRGNLGEAMKRFYEGLKKTGKSKSIGYLIKEIKDRKESSVLEDLKISISRVRGENFAATKLLVEYCKLGYDKDARKLLQSKIQILKQFFKTMCRDRFKEGNVTYFDTLKKAALHMNTISKSCFYYPLLRLYTLNKDLKNLLVLYVEMERDDGVTNFYRNFFLDSLMKLKDEVPEELQQAFQCVQEDCKRRDSTEGRVLHDKDIKGFLIEDVQPKVVNQKKLTLNLDYKNDIIKCFCLIHTGKLDEYFSFLRKKIDEDGRKKASEYFFCYKLAPHMMRNHENLDQYMELVTACGLSGLWKEFLKMCLRLNNFRKVKISIQNLNFAQLKSVVQEISYEDSLRVVESPECHRQLGKDISIFYFKVINQCMNQNNVEMAAKLYEKAKRHHLEQNLKSFAGRDFLKV